MLDFPITELLDDSLYILWLEHHLQPQGLTCPYCGNGERRLFRDQGHFPAYCCWACEGYNSLASGTIVWCRGTRASSASGAATTQPNGPATTSLRRTSRPAVRLSTRMNDRAITAAMPPMPPCATAGGRLTGHLKGVALVWTTDVAQLTLGCVDPIQWRDDVLRPVVLVWDTTPQPRAHATHTHPSTFRRLVRQFQARGMLGRLPCAEAGGV